MLAARRLTCSRPWSAATIFATRRPPLNEAPRNPYSTFHKAPYTVHMKVWQKVGGLTGCPYSQSTASATIAASNPQPDTQMLKVQWGDGGEDVFPYIWLRDNCQCPKCFHPVSLARRVMLKDLSLSVNCADVKVSNCGDQVEVHWTDGHLGTYDAQWLHERSFREPHLEPRSQQYRLERKYWGRELQDDLPRASFPELLQSNSALLTFLETLEIMGLVLVTNVPTQMDEINYLTKRIGHLQKTHYGETFEVISKLSPNNLAYTGDSLDLHTDLPFVEHKPGIQLLHCIKQFKGEGGDTLLTDGFAAAMKLRAANKKHFDTLAQTLVNFVDIGIDDGTKFHASLRTPVIELDPEGTVRNINWNQMTRDSRFHVSSETVKEWYAACLAFKELLYDAENLVTFKLQAGDLLVFDNLRVLHGRQGYRAEQGERLLQGGYWEWDCVRSRRRVLHNETAT